MSYENELCEAIELIVNNAVANANYDKTIQATIVSCIDQTIGKFKCKYQDSSFYAYATSSEVTYPKGTDVYVLVPGNDTSRDKTILGTTKKLGADYAVAPEGDEAFEVIGNNCIYSSNIFELCSYKTQKEILYEYGKENNKIQVDQKNIKEYIIRSSSVICGANFKTALSNEQKFRGNYGIIYELVFLDNATEKNIVRNYVIDVNNMDGNPYKLTHYSRQYGIFEVDGANFQYVNKISLFCYDFPNQDNNKPNDIFIKDIEFCGSVPLSAEELNSCALTLITPQGVYFDTNDIDSSIRKIQAQIRVKGKIVDKNSQSLEYYWFRENIGIGTQSEKYSKYGGQGWQCLNDYNLIKPSINNEAAIVEWVPGKYELQIKKSDSLAKETKYKCVAIYNENTVLTKEFSIINYSSNYNLSIESDSGNKFYYDIGNPTLACKVKIGNIEQSPNNLIYQWAVIDNNNNFNNLNETTIENNEYNNAVTKLQELEDKIKTETAMAAASEQKINEYKDIINKYNTIMRVEKNKIHKIQINTITSFSTYKVSVYHNGTYIGTSSIVLTNSLEAEDVYSLIINNSSQVFKYNENGISPTSDIFEKPLILNPLTFTVYDNLGNPIDEDIIRKSKINWIIPKKNTLISIPSSYDAYKISENDEEIIYEKLMGISYTIANKYNLKNTNNDIKLKVNYKEMSLTSKTDFTFTKEGEPGTNGTEFVCKITPNIASGNAPLYPMITYNESSKTSFLNYTPRNANLWFKIQLWHNGEKIYDGTSSGTSTENKNVDVTWTILSNKYGANTSDETNLSINKTTGAITYNSTLFNNPANIIKCTIKYDNLEYYSTIPVITARIVNDDYRVSLSDYTGFRYVTYSADGRTPQYDNSHPFDLKITQKINNIREDISKLTTTYKVDYTWSVKGQYYDTQWRNNNGLIARNTTGLARNQKDYKPSDDFNGYCVSNAINCIIKRGGNTLAQIHIPIHMLLNKFGNAAINTWDGNRVYLNDNGDGVILAPQVGAGKKTTNNEFTGVLMGEVKEVGKAQSNTGLFGYNAGARTIFLNSEAGSAIFGNNNGQIIIDPSSNKAILYSKNYWKNYNNNGGSTDGLPSSYNSTNENGQGMLIDLTTPKIKFGNGNFEVSSNGHLTAKGGGSIAGWSINDTQIYKNGVYIDSNLQAFYSNNKNSMTTNKTGFYIGSDGFALGAYSSTKGHNPFQVNAEGSLFSNSGSIGGFTIDDNTLIGGTGTSTVGMSSKSGVQWAFWSGNENAGDAPFHVGHNGALYSTSGQIGGWNINQSTLTGGNTTINSNGSMSGPNWSITSGGYATFTDVHITNGNTSLSQTAKLIDLGKFYVTAGGSMSATDANFTGNISGSSISGGTISGGSISGGTISGSSISGGSITGAGVTGNTITGGSINIGNNDYYLRMGSEWTKHPEVSGLNCSSVIDFGANKGIYINGNAGEVSGANTDNSVTISGNAGVYINPSNNFVIGGKVGKTGTLSFTYIKSVEWTEVPVLGMRIPTGFDYETITLYFQDGFCYDWNKG